MSKKELPEFNHYQQSAPEYTEEVLWHRVYAVVAAALLLVALLGWGIYVALKDEPESFSVDALAPTAALPAEAEPAVSVQTESSTENLAPGVNEITASAALVDSSGVETETDENIAVEIQVPEPAAAEVETTNQEIVKPADISTEEAVPSAKLVETDDSKAADAKDFAVKLQILSSDITDAALTDQMDGLEPAAKLTNTANLQDGFLKLYFYTDLQGHAGDTLIYSWYRNDKRVAKVRIPVGSDRWRSHASKNLSANMRGDWKVVVTDRKSNPLATAEFYLK